MRNSGGFKSFLKCFKTSLVFFQSPLNSLGSLTPQNSCDPCRGMTWTTRALTSQAQSGLAVFSWKPGPCPQRRRKTVRPICSLSLLFPRIFVIAHGVCSLEVHITRSFRPVLHGPSPFWLFHPQHNGILRVSWLLLQDKHRYHSQIGGRHRHLLGWWPKQLVQQKFCCVPLAVVILFSRGKARAVAKWPINAATRSENCNISKTFGHLRPVTTGGGRGLWCMLSLIIR